jgi:hypothetical protein
VGHAARMLDENSACPIHKPPPWTRQSRPAEAVVRRQPVATSMSPRLSPAVLVTFETLIKRF